MKKIPKFGLIAIALLTLFIWYEYGLPICWWQNDGWSDTIFSKPFPRPTPNPYPPIVHPRIDPASTPKPGTGRPPAI